ncbi:hypothetical protein E8E14_010619 [Neopestalotiopsis sp. 37M]|nr:hypothetical protein E8E14_010619 [Neopestalotiopsis sp. 37M]
MAGVDYSREKSTKAVTSNLFANTGLHTFLGLVNVAIYGVIIVFVHSTFDAQSHSDASSPLTDIDKLDATFMLALLRVLQALLSTFTAFSLDTSFELIQWSLISYEKGLSFTSSMALSPTTGTLGMLEILRSVQTKLSSKAWITMRGSLIFLLWVSTIVLFFQTSQIVIYDTLKSYQVTAGVGPFNGSLVQPFIDFLQHTQEGYPYQVLPYGYYAPVYNLVINPMFSGLVDPVQCSGLSECDSYLMSGGLEMVTPWIESSDAGFPLVRIVDVPSVQLEFQALPRQYQFSTSDCDILGTSTSSIAARLCLSEDEDHAGTLNAGLFICPNGMASGACTIDQMPSVPNITTSMTTFSRQATVLAGLANFTILTTESLSPPTELVDLDLASYRTALTWLLNYTASDVPAPSAIIEGFWISAQQLASPSTQGLLKQNFQSILAFPYWMFNVNSYGNLELQPQVMIDTLPSEFYTEAHEVAPYNKLIFSWTMFVLFIVFQGMALVFVSVSFVWVWIFVRRVSKSKLPIITPFPSFNTVFKSTVDGSRVTDAALIGADAQEALSLMRDVKVRMSQESVMSTDHYSTAEE